MDRRDVMTLSEDDPITLEMSRAMVEKQGQCVLTTSNKHEALKACPLLLHINLKTYSRLNKIFLS